VVGIATGGVVMASLLAFHLDLPLSIMHINFRAASNKPQRKEPELLEPFTLEGQQRVLLVDDVAVTGATFKLAKTLLQNHQISTLAIKGKADYVLFEALPSCILLPWRDTDRTT
jgi:hypoxanthine phosphoribosyltransferase